MLNHLDKHFILYAKNHYKKINENPLYDLAGIIEKACALPEGYSSPYKAYLTLSETFIKCTEDFHKRDFFKYLFSELGTLSVKGSDYHYAGQLMLNQLAIISVKEKLPDGSWKKIWDVDFGDADPKVWPLREN